MTKYKNASSYITAIGTAVPENKFSQDVIREFMQQYMGVGEVARRQLEVISRRSRIHFRHSVLTDYSKPVTEFDFYPPNAQLEPFPTVGRRMARYREEALPLAADAVRACLQRTVRTAREITHLITISCTGMYAPGLDLELLETVGMSRTVARTAINFMGCYAAFNGMKAADAIVKSQPGARVLVVCVELCSLHFQKKGTPDHLLANMLFADGASAILVEGEERTGKALEMAAFGCDVWPEGKEDMAWTIEDFGFEMKLTGRIPGILEGGIAGIFQQLLRQHEVAPEQVRYFAFHPGGRKILEAIEKSLQIPAAANRLAYEVLREYGNMSSATLFFMYERLLYRENPEGWIFSAAFGPGLTCEAALLRLHH